MASSSSRYLTFAELREQDDYSDNEGGDDEALLDRDEGGEYAADKTCSRCVVMGSIRAAVLTMFLGTLAIIAVSTSQQYPHSSFTKLVSPYLDLATSSLAGLSGASSSSKTTTTTTSSSSDFTSASMISGATSYSTSTSAVSSDTTFLGTTTDGGEDEDEEEEEGGEDVDVQSTDDWLESTDVDTPTVSTTSESNSTTTTASALQWSMTRSGYSPIDLSDATLKYQVLNGIDTIIEPYSTNALFVVGISASIYYRYQLCPEVAGDCFYGVLALNMNLNEEVELECEPHDVYTVVIKEYSSLTGSETNNYEGRAMCMYVRRELRSLTTADLTLTMDAMHALWSTEEEDGQELYGEDFHSASYMLKIHHFNAAWQDADHIHEGNGFLAQHIKMTNIFELAMQSVEPSVTLPYWDFTIDEGQGKSAFNSVVMTDTIFGSMASPVNSSWGFSYEEDNITSGAIPDGRWAYLESPVNEDFPDLQAAYGYMRAPWNMNPSPYVSRFLNDYKIGISLPSCTTHYSILQEDTLSNFMYGMQNDPHATTHSLIGGVYGCQTLSPLLDAGYLTSVEDQKALCSKWVFYLKEFYRFGYITPKKDCEVEEDVQSSTCGFECNGDMNTFLANMKTKLASYVPADMNDEGWYAWRDFICTGDGGKIFSGDHLESASPHDPSFWVIHPTLERLLHAKMMAGGFKDATWPTDNINDFVCDKAECYDSDTASLGYGADCCYGHYENDQFLDFLSGNRSLHFGDTNGAVITQSDPTSDDYAMPYIYDTFTWNHCTGALATLILFVSKCLLSLVSLSLCLTSPPPSPHRRLRLPHQRHEGGDGRLPRVGLRAVKGGESRGGERAGRGGGNGAERKVGKERQKEVSPRLRREGDEQVEVECL